MVDEVTTRALPLLDALISTYCVLNDSSHFLFSSRPKVEDPRPQWLDDPRGAYGRPDTLPGSITITKIFL